MQLSRAYKHRPSRQALLRLLPTAIQLRAPHDMPGLPYQARCKLRVHGGAKLWHTVASSCSANFIGTPWLQCNRSDTLGRIHEWLTARYKAACKDGPRCALVRTLALHTTDSPCPQPNRRAVRPHWGKSAQSLRDANELVKGAHKWSSCSQFLYVKSSFMPPLEEEIGALADVRFRLLY